MASRDAATREAICRDVIGQVDRTEYFNTVKQGDIDPLEAAVGAWLASGPGTYVSKESNNPYQRAHRDFERHSGMSIPVSALELALANNGYRVGPIVRAGELIWLLWTPSKKDLSSG